MPNFEPSPREQEAMRKPKLLHGLMVAAQNGFNYFVDVAAYPFDPNPNSSEPKRRPNYELGEWLGRLKDPQSYDHTHED